jgi:predicted transcriptional regulator
VKQKLTNLYKLLFELSNEDRLNILLELKKTPMKLSRISQMLTFTVPEAARNISRLTEANLIVKDSDGQFHLTPFGEGALLLLPSFEFLSRNEKYFMTHSVSKLPPQFLAEIVALKESKFISEIATTLFNAEKMMREAQEYIWVFVDQILASSLSIIIEAINRGVEFRKLMPRNAQIAPEILALANDPFFTKATSAKKLESRYLEKIDIAIFLSEKEVAALCFPNQEGIFDFLSFKSSNKSSHRWAKDLFSYYWSQSKP